MGMRMHVIEERLQICLQPVSSSEGLYEFANGEPTDEVTAIEWRGGNCHLTGFNRPSAFSALQPLVLAATVGRLRANQTLTIHPDSAMHGRTWQ